MTRFLSVLAAFLLLNLTTSAMAQYDVRKIYANDGTYLGNTGNQYDSDSIHNPYGKYGSQYSSQSINNPYGSYGSQYSTTSPNNQYAAPGYSVSPYGNDRRRFGGSPYMGY